MEDLSQCLPFLQGDVEIAILLMDYDGEDTGEEVMLGCYYYVNMATKEVFYLDEVTDAHFYPGCGTELMSREHLSKYFFTILSYPH